MVETNPQVLVLEYSCNVAHMMYLTSGSYSGVGTNTGLWTVVWIVLR